ncbi:MAG: histidine kinase [Pedobacter sp.]
MKRKPILLVTLIILFLLALISVPILLKEDSFFKGPKYFFNKLQGQANLSDSTKINRIIKIAFSQRLTNPQKTIDQADSALILAKRINYYYGIAEANRTKGVGFFYLNDTEHAVKSYIEALKYFRLINDIRNEARVYNNIGNLYREINYNSALYFYNKALSISKNLNNNELLAGLYLNIATIFRFKGDYQNSLRFLEISNKIFTARKDTINMIAYLQNSGIIYYKLNDFKTAKTRLFEAILKAHKYKLYKVLVGSNLTLAAIYLEQKQYSNVENSINDGIYYSTILEDSTSIKYFNYKAFELEQKRKNYPKALEYLKEVYKHDSLLLSKNLSDNIGKTSSHYLQLQKIQENELVIARQKYKETQYWWIITIIISILLLTALCGIILYFILQKKQKRKELEVQNTIVTLEQKALQAMMNPHFLFNTMTSIQYFIEKNESKTANQVLTGFARLMRKHLEICLKNTLTLYEELQYLRIYLSLEKIRFADKMNYVIRIDKKIETEEILIPPMLIQPFIENAIWHGIMPIEEGGFIQIDINCNGNNQLIITIQDNGIGLSNSLKSKAPEHTSRGLQLIHERVSLLNKLNKTTIQIIQSQTGESGTEVVIYIPI